MQDGVIAAQLDGSATIKVVDNAKNFDDIAFDSWMADAVAFVAARELFNETGQGEFSPAGSMTRGMLATVLHRLELKPESSMSGSFADVDGDSWYADSVEWAAESGIVTGVSEGKFDGEREITRAELVTMLYRYAKQAGLATEGRAGLSDRLDGKAVPEWAAEAFSWAVSADIVTGAMGGILRPNAVATRGEVAAVLMKLVQLVAE